MLPMTSNGEMFANLSWDASGKTNKTSIEWQQGINWTLAFDCRATPESDIDDDLDGSVLSLGLFSGEYITTPGDDRTMFRFEAAWDSSLHNSLLLNRVTPSGETIYMTISAYLEVLICKRNARYGIGLILEDILVGKCRWSSHYHKRPCHDCLWTGWTSRSKNQTPFPRHIPKPRGQ